MISSNYHHPQPVSRDIGDVRVSSHVAKHDGALYGIVHMGDGGSLWISDPAVAKSLIAALAEVCQILDPPGVAEEVAQAVVSEPKRIDFHEMSPGEQEALAVSELAKLTPNWLDEAEARDPAYGSEPVEHDCGGGCCAVPGRKCVGGECWRDQPAPACGNRKVAAAAKAQV
jgi:hypothetical protein